MKRFLTEEEIEFILNFIDIPDYIPIEIAITTIENNKEKLKVQLREQKVYLQYQINLFLIK